MSGETMMTRGVFARRSRLSSKALRLYEQNGLLEPAEIDATNGYRYYTEQQLEHARLIGLLRRLDMPMARIRQVIGRDPDDLVSAIGEHWNAMHVAHREQSELARYLMDRLSGRRQHMFTIDRRTVAEQRVASIEERVLAPELPAFIHRAMSALHRHLEESGCESAAPFVVYHGEVGLDSDGPVEVCVPFDGSLEPYESIRVRIESGHEEAYTRITKAQVRFPEILDAYRAVESWLGAEGRPIVGSPREIYFTDWDGAADDDAACDIAFPIGGSE